MQTFTGREYLKIDIANNFGLDKEDWKIRLHWFNQNEHQLDHLVSQAKEPALFFAGINAYRDVQAGKPIGYMISLDATSSGLQLLAALTGDSVAAKLCNVVSTGHREDAYTGVYNHMLHRVQDTAKISRDQTKDAIMTSLYGSKAVPKQVFGEGALLDVFYGSLKELAPAAWELNETMLALWDPNAFEHSWILPDNFHVHVKVMAQVRETVHFLNQPFDVYYNINAPIAEGRSLGANTIHSIDGMIVREMTRRCDYDPKKVDRLYSYLANKSATCAAAGGIIPVRDRAKDIMVQTLWQNYQITGYLSARIIDYLDSANLCLVNPHEIKELLDSLPVKPFTVVSIHDCFRCLPHYGNDLREQYNLQLQLIAKSDMLSSIVSQLVGRHIPINKLDPQLWRQVGSTNYALS
jgi:hypothetical protein